MSAEAPVDNEKSQFADEGSDVDAVVEAEEEQVLRLGTDELPDAKLNFGEALARIQQDPLITTLQFLMPPTGQQVALLQRSLKRVSRLLETRMQNGRGMEQWVLALLPLTMVCLESDCENLDAFHRILVARGAKRVALRGSCASIGYLEEQQTLIHAYLTIRDGDEDISRRLFHAVSRIPSLKIDYHESFSARSILDFGAALALSDTLTSLELCDYAEKNTLGPLWSCLGESRVCGLQKLKIEGGDESRDGLELFLASSHAREHLVELRLTGTDSRAPFARLLSAIANCATLGVFVIDFDTTYGEFTEVDLAATLKAFAARNFSHECALKTLVFSTAEHDDSPLFNIAEQVFLQQLAATGVALGTLTLYDPRFQRIFLSSIAASVRTLSIACDANAEEEDSDFSEALTALSRNQCLTTLDLSIAGVTFDVHETLLSWFARAAPPTLVDLTLRLDYISATAFLQLAACLAARPLVHLRLRVRSSDYNAVNATHCAAFGLLLAVPSLQTLELGYPCVTKAKLSDLQREESLVASILAHSSLERTDPVLEDRDEVKAALEARRLRRHHLVAHWAHVAVSLACARGHPKELHGAVLPLLPAISALASILMPQQGWIELFMRTAYIACETKQRTLAGSKRKR